MHLNAKQIGKFKLKFKLMLEMISMQNAKQKFPK